MKTSIQVFIQVIFEKNETSLFRRSIGTSAECADVDITTSSADVILRAAKAIDPGANVLGLRRLEKETLHGNCLKRASDNAYRGRGLFNKEASDFAMTFLEHMVSKYYSGR